MQIKGGCMMRRNIKLAISKDRFELLLLRSWPVIIILIATVLISGIVHICVKSRSAEREPVIGPDWPPKGYTIIKIEGEELLYPAAPEGYSVVVTDGKPAYLKNISYSGCYDFFNLPFIEEMEQLGAEVVWNSETEATLTYEGQTFFVELDRECITDADGEVLSYEHDDCAFANMCYAAEDDLIIDNVLFSHFFERAGLETCMTFGEIVEKYNVYYLYTIEYYNRYIN